MDKRLVGVLFLILAGVWFLTRPLLSSPSMGMLSAHAEELTVEEPQVFPQVTSPSPAEKLEPEVLVSPEEPPSELLSDEEFQRQEEEWGIRHDKEQKYLNEIVTCSSNIRSISSCYNHLQIHQSLMLQIIQMGYKTPEEQANALEEYSGKEIDGCLTSRRSCPNPDAAIFQYNSLEEIPKEEVVCSILYSYLEYCSNGDQIMSTIDAKNPPSSDTVISGCYTSPFNCLN